MNDLLKAFLSDIRQHPGFPELLEYVQPPSIPRFRMSDAEEVEKARAGWIYRSGQVDQHERWLLLLRGTDE